MTQIVNADGLRHQ